VIGGRSPGAIIKWLPKALTLTYRDLVEVEIEKLTADEAVLVYRCISPVFFDEPVYSVVIESQLRAMLSIGGAPNGHVTLRRSPADKTFTVTARWGGGAR